MKLSNEFNQIMKLNKLVIRFIMKLFNYMIRLYFFEAGNLPEEDLPRLGYKTKRKIKLF